MAPPPCSCMIGTTARDVNHIARRLMSMIRCQVDSSSSNGAASSLLTPTLFTSTSMRPIAALASSTIRAQSSGDCTSATITCA